MLSKPVALPNATENRAVPIQIRRRTSNLYIITFRKEDTILSHSFQHIKASIKDLIEIYNDDFSANN